MKRVLLILFLSFVPILALAQTSLSVRAGGGYNRAARCMGETQLLLQHDFAPNFRAGAGYRFNSFGLGNAFQAGGKVMLPLGGFDLTLESRGIWDLRPTLNVQEFNTMFLAGSSFWKGRIELKAGLFNKFYTTIGKQDNTHHWVFEPLNLAYYGRVWLLPRERNYNVSLALFNVNDFLAERAFAPIMELGFLCQTGKVDYFLELRMQNAGVFNVTNSFYGGEILVGARWRW